MPLYEYQCKDCGAIVEKIQKFSDAPLRKCEKCGGKLERLLSSPTIQFKGSGFYITDYARKSGADTGKSSSAPDGDKSSAKSDGAKTAQSKPVEAAKKPETSTVTK
ncbi:MAG TPA: FmdB family zinc ribbon protein [Terriglobia bacterium]|nr:FmdB family zinc ribbon protein [Terriglobia bacterium]